jgi:hypothetical protein
MTLCVHDLMAAFTHRPALYEPRSGTGVICARPSYQRKRGSHAG